MQFSFLLHGFKITSYISGCFKKETVCCNFVTQCFGVLCQNGAKLDVATDLLVHYLNQLF